jgi:RNA polymerase sigma-70 factor (ECF subfamily)
MPIRRCLTEIASDEKSRSRPRNRRPEAEGDPEILLGAAETLRTSLALYLPPSQRSAVILEDVLGHSTEEIAELLGFSVAAVQGCLHRGRALKPEYERPSDPIPPVVLRYAELFGAANWDGVRSLLAEEVRLDLVGHMQRTGRSRTMARAAAARHLAHYPPR